MKKLKLEQQIDVYSLDELTNEYRKLYNAAVLVAGNAYAPYSRFRVGAAVLLANGEIISGSNQENAAYPSGLCAERVALFYAGSQYPDVPVLAIAISAFSEDRQVEQIAPCGGCRQVLLETEMRSECPMKVLLCGTDSISIIESASSLLPFCFDGSDLPK